MPEFIYFEPIDFEPISLSLWGPGQDGETYGVLQRFGLEELEQAAESCRLAATLCDGMSVLVADGPDGEQVAVLCHDLNETLCVGEAEIDCPGVDWRHPQFDELLPRRPPRP